MRHFMQSTVLVHIYIFFFFFLSLFFYRLCTAGYVLYAGVSYKGENMVLRSVTLGNSPFLH